LSLRSTTFKGEYSLGLRRMSSSIPPSPSKRAVEKTEAEWRAQLTPEQYHVARQSGTEPPFTNRFWKFSETGQYRCVGCDALLFDSTEKFYSSCGWPAFDRGKPGNMEEVWDRSFGLDRIEVKCRQCGSHLGHLFDDGPTETGMRYCINSTSLKFIKE
jgi:methionine-R-sulfoxide reductase